MNPLNIPDDHNGSGQADRDLADKLRAATTTEEADAIARRDGLIDGADAALWLRERS